MSDVREQARAARCRGRPTREPRQEQEIPGQLDMLAELDRTSTKENRSTGMSEQQCRTCGGDMTDMTGPYCSSQCRDEQ